MTMGRSCCAPESRLAGLALILFLAAFAGMATGAGVFSADEGDSAAWRAEFLRLQGVQDRGIGNHRYNKINWEGKKSIT